jgi:geranylgeranyl diphosphate synthase, type II
MLPFQNLLTSFEAVFHKEVQSIQSTAPVQLYEPIAYSLKGGGKRIRPVLMLHAASLLSNQLEGIYPAAIAIELFHNFTLLHDDIMDHAGIRRGDPAVHVKYGENSAILSGDAMSIMAFEFLSRCLPAKLPTALALFSRSAMEVCEGQQLDMDFEERDQVTIPEYLEMIRLKTSVLIACSLKTGALLVGGDEKFCQLLYDFGIQIGIAFQLQDDWLDVFGNEETFGKKIGGDIRENKKTFLLLKALEMADEKNLSELKGWLSKSDFEDQEKIESVREIFSNTGASEATRVLMREYHNKAIDALNQIDLPDSEKLELRKFAASVVERIK